MGHVVTPEKIGNKTGLRPPLARGLPNARNLAVCAQRDAKKLWQTHFFASVHAFGLLIGSTKGLAARHLEDPGHLPAWAPEKPKVPPRTELPNTAWDTSTHFTN